MCQVLDVTLYYANARVFSFFRKTLFTGGLYTSQRNGGVDSRLRGNDTCCATVNEYLMHAYKPRRGALCAPALPVLHQSGD
jgi:hypothetical protein